MHAAHHCASADRIAVLLTCFNRRQKTLACIDAVFAQTALEAVRLDFYITDDGSTDGTAAALIGKDDRIRLLHGNGSLFWNGGMRLAWTEAMGGSYDFFLLLNDDTFLYPETLQRMIATYRAVAQGGTSGAIVVGSTHDATGQISYGGERQRSRLRPLTLSRITPKEVAQRCDTFNGNCVLISSAAAKVLGNLDPGFIHAMGDTDYGLRARQAGIPMWVMPGFAGGCIDDASIAGGYTDPTLPLATRLAKAMGPKGLPWRAWLVLCQRHAGWLWPIYWSWPYLKIVATSCYFGACKRIGRAVS